MKTCKECHIEKPLSEFHSHPKMADGTLNICKACKREYQRGRDAATKADPERRKKEADRQRKKSLRQYHEKRKLDPDYTARHNETASLWRGKNPEKARAHSAVARAVRSGRLVRPKKCPECGRKGKMHAHHEDYTKPLEVEWACPACHLKKHRTR